MDITRGSIQRPVVVIVFSLLILAIGIYSYTRLNYELVPKFTPEVITVATVYPGASPEEVEQSVSIVIEDALSGIENVEILTSTSRESFSLVRMELTAGIDVNLRLQDVQRKVAAVQGQLPDQARTPIITRFDFDDLPVMRIGMSSVLSPFEFSDLAKDQIVPALSRLEGVAEVRLLGEQNEEIKVDVSNDLLNYYDLTILQVVQAIRMYNQDIPVGSIDSRGNTRTLKLSGRLTTVDELENVPVIHPRTKASIPLKSLAEVYKATSEIQVVNRVNLQNSLGLDIKKRGGANAVEMSQRVRVELELLEARYQDAGLDFNISQDTSEFTLEAANAVMEDLGLAIVLVSLVMLLFLHSLRNSLIVLVSIPLSIITTFIAMNLLGYTLNLLSLLGLSLAIGILVDDSIVVIENIYRHLEMGKKRADAAYEGRMEIGFTAVSITLIDVVVFLPIIFASGMVADLLRQFSVVIVVSTLMSLLVSFTVVPLLVSRFGKHEIVSAKTWLGRLIHGFESGIESFARWMTSLLDWAVSHKFITLFIALILLLGSIGLVLGGLIGIEFVKGGDRGEFLVEIELPRGTPLVQTDEVTRIIEDYLARQPEVTGIFTTVGITSAGRIELNSENLSELTVKLIDKEYRSKSASLLAREFKLHLESVLPGVQVRPIDINLLGLRDDDVVQVTVASADKDQVYNISRELVASLDSIRGTVEVNSSASVQSVETVIETDRALMETYKVNPVITGATLRTAVNGNQDNAMKAVNGDIPIHIRLQGSDKRISDDLLNMSVFNELGQLIQLNQFARTHEELSPGQLERTNRTPSVTIKSQVIGRTGGQVNSEFNKRINEANYPDDVYFIAGGQTKRTQEGIMTMLGAFAASIFLVYFVLVILYNSFMYPFVVLFSIPMAMIGALLALALTMEALSIFSILGLVMLVGLVGKNAILVVDFTNRLRMEGLPTREALVKATQLRFRPVLMTNLSMIIGLLPIAIASGAGSEWKNGLAWVIIGGLSSSMLLTLIIVPVIYALFAREMKSVEVASR